MDSPYPAQAWCLAPLALAALNTLLHSTRTPCVHGHVLATRHRSAATVICSHCMIHGPRAPTVYRENRSVGNRTRAGPPCLLHPRHHRRPRYAHLRFSRLHQVDRQSRRGLPAPSSASLPAPPLIQTLQALRQVRPSHRARLLARSPNPGRQSSRLNPRGRLALPPDLWVHRPPPAPFRSPQSLQAR